MSAALAVDADKLYRKVMWRLMPILCLGYVLNYIDRTNIGFAQLQMKDQLAFGDAVFGLGASIFFIGYALFEIPSNLVLARWGARLTFLRIMVAWGLISALMAFVSTPLQFYVVRFFLGVAEAGFAPGVLFYLGLWFPDRRRAQAMALFFAAFAAAPILSGPLAGVIMTLLDGVSSLRGWQWLFLLEGLPTVLVGVYAYRRLDDRPADAAWLTAPEKQAIAAALAADASAQHGASARTLRDAVFDGRVWMLSAIYFLVLLGVYAVTFWQPTMMAAMGLTIWQVGFYSAIPALAGVAAAILVGRHSDRTGERRLHFAIPAVVAAVGLIGTALSSQAPALAICFLALTTAGAAAAVPVFWSTPNAILSKDAAAGGIAMINTLGISAAMVAPAMVGAIKAATGGFSLSLYILAGALVLSAALMMRAGRGWTPSPTLNPAHA